MKIEAEEVMVRFVIFATAIVTMLAATPAHAAATTFDWSGVYVGIQGGFNDVTLSTASPSSGPTAAVFAGYRHTVASRFVLGGDAIYEWNETQHHSFIMGGETMGTNVLGVDLQLGFPVATLLPYVKVGYGTMYGKAGLDGERHSAREGVGVEWKMEDHISLVLQYMHQRLSHSDSSYTNNNATIGLTFSF